MSIHSLSALLAAIVIAAIGLSVLLRDHRRRSFRAFAFQSFVVALWELSSFLGAAFLNKMFDLAAIYFAIAIPPATIYFFRCFLSEDPAGPPPRRPSLAIVTGAGLGIAATWYVLFRPIHLPVLLWDVPFGIYIYLGLYSACIEIYRVYSVTISRVEKKRMGYLIVGTLATTTLAFTQFLPTVNVALPTTGNVLTIIFLYFLSQTLFRFRLLDLQEMFGKMVVLAALVVFLSVIYGLLVVWVGADQQGMFFFNTLVASFVILILYEPARAFLENEVNRRLFREKHELRQRLEGLRRELAQTIDATKVVQRLLDSLGESRRVTHASVWLIDRDGARLELAGHFGPRPATGRVDLAALRPLADRLRQNGYVTLEGLQRDHASRVARAAHNAPPDPELEVLDLIAAAMDSMSASACVAMLVEGGELAGCLALRDERLREAYATEELDHLRILCTQAALVLQNSETYERMKERDRLAAIGEMAAGLAHEIRNPLGAIKGAAQLLLPNATTPTPTTPEGSEFLGVIVEEVNRLNRVVSQFLDYARPYRGEPSSLDINQVVRKTAQLLEGQAAEASVTIELQLEEGLPRVHADGEQLRQVFLNLGLNALQAMMSAPANGSPHRLLLLTRMRRRARRGEPAQFVEVRFHDSGPGIPETARKNLFIPFFTTKDKGTGLGLPICQRIIQHHGGSIEVKSDPGHGATFTVLLPRETDGEGAATTTAKMVVGSRASRPES